MINESHEEFATRRMCLKQRMLICASAASVVAFSLVVWMAVEQNGEQASGTRQLGSSLSDLKLPDAAEMSTPFIVPGNRQPKTFAATDVTIDDDAEVLGVGVSGKYRAYVVESLSAKESHIVNDLIEKTPISVTYCDRTDCARVFTKAMRETAIDLGTGGRGNGGSVEWDVISTGFREDSFDRLPL